MPSTTVGYMEDALSLEDLVAFADDRAWAEGGLCIGKADLFFAPPGERRTRRNKRETLARSYCDICEVLETCREWARTNREHGFWGGESEEQRAKMGYPPRSPSRRAVAELGRAAARSESDETQNAGS